MASSGDKEIEPSLDLGEERHPFTYKKMLGIGRHTHEKQITEMIGEDQAVVSTMVDELLKSSAIGREFARNSLSIRNATREEDEEISTNM
jgi:hypothetical protein